MLRSLSIPVPAVRGFFGTDLTTFQTQIRPDQIVQILGHDPRSVHWRRLTSDLRQMYEYLQRPTNKDRREGIAEYIENRLGPNSYAIGSSNGTAVKCFTV